MPEPPELVIFDCDGVLVDSEWTAVRIESRLLTELGWPLTPADVADRFVGRSDDHMLGEIEAHLGRAVPDWKQTYEAALNEEFCSSLTAVPGVADALEALESLAVATCVASSGTHDKMRLTLGLTGLYERFDGRIFSASQVANGKPAPDLFLYAAEQMGADPARCVVVEDSPPGLAAARAAGMGCVAYAGGLIPVERLEGPGTIVIDDMSLLSAAIAQVRT